MARWSLIVFLSVAVGVLHAPRLAGQNTPPAKSSPAARGETPRTETVRETPPSYILPSIVGALCVIVILLAVLLPVRRRSSKD